MTRFRIKFIQIKLFATILRHFENPFLIFFLRLGMIKLPYFLYRIRNQDRSFAMLARPTTTSMADLFVLREVLVDEAYQDILPLLKKSPLRVVDIGANLGSFTIWLQKRIGLSEAFCFEPEPDSFRLLAFNLSKNGCGAARAFPFAVGGEERMIQMSLKESSPGGSSIYQSSAAVQAQTANSIRVIRFEDWLRQTPGNFDLLKMDCEGAEWEILQRTDRKQFERFRVFVAEVHSDPENNRSIPDFISLTESLGFRTVRWDARSQGLYVGVRDVAP